MVSQMNNETQSGAPEAREAESEGTGASLEEQLAKAQEAAQRFEDNWKRAAADLQNYKRRAEEERTEARRLVSEAIIHNLLPIVDDFERAFATVDSHLRHMTWIDGVFLIYRKLDMLLQNNGVKPMEALGKPFDPQYHEAVQHVDGEDGKVIAEVQRGYMIGDRVLRPAMVVVGKGAEAETKEPDAGDEAKGEEVNDKPDSEGESKTEEEEQSESN
jgi:molecular chaperone GrpE